MTFNLLGSILTNLYYIHILRLQNIKKNWNVYTIRVTDK